MSGVGDAGWAGVAVEDSAGVSGFVCEVDLSGCGANGGGDGDDDDGGGGGVGDVWTVGVKRETEVFPGDRDLSGRSLPPTRGRGPRSSVWPHSH